MPIGIYKYAIAYEPKKLPPLEEQKSKETLKREAYEAFLEALPKPKETLRLVSERSVAEPFKRMRIRQGKPGKEKRRTPNELLAKAEEKYNKFGEMERIKNDGFNKFNQLPIVNTEINSSLSDKLFGIDKTVRAVARAKRNISNCTLIQPFPTKKINGEGIVYTQTLAPVRNVVKVKCNASADVAILQSVNRLLRQILLFKGIGFADVERDIRQNNGKPVTYMVNTTIEYDKLGLNKAELIRCIRVHTIVVKKTFRTSVNNGGVLEEQCNMFFDSRCCQPITQWIKTINFF